MTTRQRRQPAEPATVSAAPAVAPPAPQPPVPEKAVLTAAQLRDAMTWEFELAPGHVVTCRHLGQEDVLFLGIVPLPLQERFATMGVSAVQGDALNIDPDVVKVLEDYACRAALEPRLIARAEPGQPTPEEPAGSVGVWHLNIATLARLFTAGIARVVEVRPLASTFPRPDEPAAGELALHGDTVRAASEPLAAPRADA